MNLISKYAAAALLTLTGVAIAMPAKAIPTLRLTQNANVILVEDNDANDVNSLAGVVSFAGPVGDYLLTSSVGITKRSRSCSTNRVSITNIS